MSDRPEHLPEPPPEEPAGVPLDEGDLDARFAQIVAGWDRSATSSGSDRLPPPEPVAPGAQQDRPPPADDAEPGNDPPGSTFLVLPEPPTGWRGYAPPEPEEHFEPPTPQLPPAHDATYWLALAGLVAGPLFVLWAAVLSGNPDPGWWVLIGCLATVVGFGLLVLRGSGERDPDDDGARV